MARQPCGAFGILVETRSPLSNPGDRLSIVLISGCATVPSLALKLKAWAQADLTLVLTDINGAIAQVQALLQQAQGDLLSLQDSCSLKGYTQQA